MLKIFKKEFSHHGNVTICELHVGFEHIFDYHKEGGMCLDYLDTIDNFVKLKKFRRFVCKNHTHEYIFRGVSRCKKGDLYDEVKGKEIAFRRALKSMNMVEHEFVKTLFNIVTRMCLHYDKILAKSEYRIKNNDDKLLELTK